MSVGLYMDVHVKRAVTIGIRLRGVDVITAQEDATAELDDPSLLDRATKLGRVLFSQDEDMLAEAAARQRAGKFFSGLIYVHQAKLGVGQCIADLEILAKLSSSSEFESRVEYLPLTSH